MVQARTLKALAEQPEVLGEEARLESLKKDLDFRLMDEGRVFLEMVNQSEAYKKGNWHELNKKFSEAFAGLEKGPFKVTEKMAERLLIHLQENMFRDLGLEGDAHAVADGKIGPYTLYCMSLYLLQKRPKEKPRLAGNPKLAKLIDEDLKAAYDQYVTRFNLQGITNTKDFEKQYERIVTEYGYINPENAEFAEFMQGMPSYAATDNKEEIYYEVAKGKFCDAEGKLVELTKILPRIAKTFKGLVSLKETYILEDINTGNKRYFDEEGTELTGALV